MIKKILLSGGALLSLERERVRKQLSDPRIFDETLSVEKLSMRNVWRGSCPTVAWLEKWEREKERERERETVEHWAEARDEEYGERREETEESLRSRHTVLVLASSGRYRSTGVPCQVITKWHDDRSEARNEEINYECYWPARGDVTVRTVHTHHLARRNERGRKIPFQHEVWNSKRKCWTGFQDQRGE